MADARREPVTELTARLDRLRDRIRAAASACGRDPASVRLVAVAKTFPADIVRAAAIAGATDIGENYIQEARAKVEALADLNLRWHFIGHLQSNKARQAVRMFDLIHTVDSVHLAAEIDRAAAQIGKLQRVLVQVNVGGEDSKSGVPPAEAVPLVESIARMKSVQVRGLMTLPPFFDAPDRVRPFFAELRRIAARIRAMNLPGVQMDELSMGMTGDFEAAIAEGATLVRVGTAIFGGRS
jgi:pyridoxal phosphate enzyme (YggS family)